MGDKTEKLPEPPSLIDQGAGLLKLLGGTKTTTSPGDTSALQSTLAGLQGQDYEAMLKAIFQQAGGQIPGLQQALGNAIGARSGGNSAVQAALQKLLAQTSTGAMDQVAKLQAQNFATQVQAGNSIAQATQGTTKKEGTNVSGGLANAAKILALLQGAKQLGADKWIKDLTSATPEATTSAAMTTAANSAFSSPTAPLSTAETPMFNLTAGAFQPTAGVSSDVPGVPQVTDPGFQYVDMTGFQQPYQQPQYTPSFEQAPSYQSVIPEDYYNETYTFADGGIVKKPEGYADGGTVRAGGSRRSANPEVELRDPDQMLAQFASSELAGQFAPQALASPIATASGADMANAMASAGNLTGGGGGSNDSFSGGFNSTSGGISPQDFGNAVNKAGAISNISGALGGPTLGQAGGVLGLAAGLANAPNKEAALGVAGKYAANMAVPGLGGLIGFAQNPTGPNAINFASAFNPATATVNAGLSLFGLASLGEIAENVYDRLAPREMMSPVQQTIQSIEAGNPNSFGMTQQANAMPGDALGNLMGLTDSFGTGGGGNDTSGGGGTNSSGGTGDTGSDGVGGGRGASGDSRGSDGANADGNMKNGGPIAGTGSGTSDSININVSDGEYIMSADVVEKLGEDFFNQLQAAFHTPAAQQRKQG
jgi:hypothetical protein